MLINNCDTASDFVSTGSALAVANDTSIKLEGTGSLKMTSAYKLVDYGASSGQNWGGTNTESYWTQTFTAVSTNIEKLRIKIDTSEMNGESVVVTLYADDGAGKPTGGALASASYAAGDLTDDAEKEVIFTASGLTVGTRYVIQFADTNTSGTSAGRFGLYTNGSGSTPAGQASWKYNVSTSSWEDVTASIKHIHLEVVDYAEGESATDTISAINLSGVGKIFFWAQSTVAGALMRIQMGESAVTEQTYTFTINDANTWERKQWDISAIAAASRNAITKIGFQVIDDTSDFIMYIDDLRTSGAHSGCIV